MADIDWFVVTDSAGGNGLTRATSTGSYWAISIDNLGTEPSIDDELDDGTTTAVVKKIIVNHASGWASATKAVLVLAGGDPSWANNATIHNNSDADSTVGDVAIHGSLGEFWIATNSDAAALASLSNWEAQVDGQGDLNDSTLTAQVHCSRGTNDDTAQCFVVGFSSAWACKLIISGDDGTADGVVALTAGKGKNTGNTWDTGAYVLHASPAANYALSIQDSYPPNITVQDLQVKHTSSSNVHGPVGCYGSKTHMSWKRNWCWEDGTTAVVGISWWVLPSAATTHVCEANVVLHDGAAGGAYGGIIANSGGGTSVTCNIYNNFIDGKAETGGSEIARGIYMLSGINNSTTINAYNNCIRNTATADIVDSSGATFTENYNAKDDATVGGNDIQVTTWTDECNDPDNAAAGDNDYRPKSTGQIDAAGSSTNQSALDITGASWTSDNIGPFNEVVSAGGGTIPPIYMHYAYQRN